MFSVPDLLIHGVNLIQNINVKVLFLKVALLVNKLLRDSSLRNEHSGIIYSPSCCPKPVSFFSGTQAEIVGLLQYMTASVTNHLYGIFFK